MKKFRIGCMLMLVTAMAVVFTACGGDDSGNNNETSTENVSQNNNDMNNAGTAQRGRGSGRCYPRRGISWLRNHRGCSSGA